jgi:hypothetical protein
LELPKDEELANSGKEWALIALSKLSPNMRAKAMLLWWRAWHLRNNIIFRDRKCGIKSSTEYLDNYLRTLTDIREGREETDVKGKKPVMEQGHAKIIPYRNHRNGNLLTLDGNVSLVENGANILGH